MKQEKRYKTPRKYLDLAEFCKLFSANDYKLTKAINEFQKKPRTPRSLNFIIDVFTHEKETKKKNDC